MNKVLYFKSKFCGQCRKYLPVIEQLKNDYSNIEFEIIDVDENKELVEKYQISTIPTIVLIKNNKVVRQIKGMIPKSKLIEAIEAIDK